MTAVAPFPPGPGVPVAPVDPLGAVLADLRLRSTFHCRTEGAAPWGVDVPAFEGCMTFHVVTEGSCVLEVGGVRTLLGPGDLALVPHQEHVLRSSPDARVVGRADLLPQRFLAPHYSLLRVDGGGARTGLVCGVVQPERAAAAHLLALLPPVLHVDGRDTARYGWLPALLDVIAHEAGEGRPGSVAVVSRLADVVVLQAVRAWLAEEATGPGWLRALQDPQVGRAVTELHRDPGAGWTLARLAREAQMSRTSFAARFTEVAGEPVMRFVARWRMHLATVALADGARVGEVARQLGYESEAAFSRAYKRLVGVSPGTVARRGAPGTPAGADVPESDPISPVPGP